MLDFRSEANSALNNAKAELEANDNKKLKYAALELRIAIEALAYDKAKTLADELPIKEYETWQPRKLMLILLEIDPNINKISSVSFGEEKEFGVPPDDKDMHFLGTEQPITFEDIKKHYDALGSFLHMPTLGQLQKESVPNYCKLKERCNLVIGILEKILSSPVFNLNIDCSSSVSCGNCNATIRRRLPIGLEKVEAHCLECEATYLVSYTGQESAVDWAPLGKYVSCPNQEANCKEKYFLFKNEIKTGVQWKCKGCGCDVYIGFGTFLKNKA